METILTDEEVAALLDMVIERVRADLGDGKPLRLKERRDETSNVGDGNGDTWLAGGITADGHSTGSDERRLRC